MKNLFKYLEDFLKLNQFQYYLFRLTENVYWDEIVFKHSIFSTHFISSQIFYEEEYNNIIENNSFLICDDKEICIVKLYNSSEKIFFGIQFSENFNYSKGKKTIKKIIDVFLTFRISPFFLNNYCSSNLHNYFLYLSSKHFVMTESFEIFVDLSKSEQELWSGLRKSYRSIINKSKKELEVVKTYITNEWDNFKEIHKTVSGRSTRNDMSWDIQKKRVSNKFAKVYYIKKGNRIIGFSYFNLGNDYAQYAVGAYLKQEFESLSISHLILWESIIDLKRHGFKFVYLGRSIPLEDKNDKKLKAINDFKTGFSNLITKNIVFN